MSSGVIVFIITAFAIIFGASYAAIYIIKKKDREAGLELNEEEYGLFAPFKHLFKKDDRRFEAETGETVSEYIKRTGARRYIGLVSIFGIAISLIYAAATGTDLYLAILTSFMFFIVFLSPNIFLPIFLVIFSIVVRPFGFATIAPSAAALILMVTILLRFRSHGKNRT